MSEEKRKAKSRLEDECSREKEQTRAFERLDYLCLWEYFGMTLFYEKEKKKYFRIPIKSQN